MTPAAWRTSSALRTSLLDPRPSTRKATRAFAAAVAIALVAGCAQLPSRPSAGPITDVAWDVPPPSPTRLSPVYATEKARRDTAERIWQLVNDRFYDPRFNGANWAAVGEQRLPQAAAARSDAELYRALKGMLAELRDPHTEVLSPREAVDLRRFVAPRNGVALAVVDGELAVLDVEPDSPGAAAGLRPGDVVRALNGTAIGPAFLREAAADPATLRAEPLAGDGPEALPADPRDAERVRAMRAVRRLLRSQLAAADAPSAGPPPAPARLKLEVARPERSAPLALEVVAAERARPPRTEFRWLDGDIALIRFNRFHPSVRDELERALANAAAARGVIVDLRGNGGGLLELYRWFVGHFIAEERVPMRTTARDRGAPAAQTVADLVVTPRPRPLLQPLAVLVDGRTASSAELTAVTLAEQRGALLVGEPTCGCAVAVRVEYVLPDGGGLRIAETGFVSARGARMQDAPTLPAVRVAPTLADLRSGRDAALEEARRRLLARLSAARAAAALR
jgi:C-terminal processing protease CtpA/Prc